MSSSQVEINWSLNSRIIGLQKSGHQLLAAPLSIQQRMTFLYTAESELPCGIIPEATDERMFDLALNTSEYVINSPGP